MPPGGKGGNEAANGPAVGGGDDTDDGSMAQRVPLARIRPLASSGDGSTPSKAPTGGNGSGGGDAENNRKLLRELAGLPREKRRACFVCVIAFLTEDDSHRFFVGECLGHIVESERGSNGFGYDPLFEVDGHRKTMAELEPSEKLSLSHRSIAMKKWLAFVGDTRQ